MSILIRSAALIRASCASLLTQDCLLCAAESGNRLLCRACTEDLPQLPAARCPRCALPTPLGELCGRCLSRPPHYDAGFAVHPYAFPIDRLVQSFKYGHRLALGNWFGQQLAAVDGNIEAELIIPMPLHPLRLRERGFNQAGELARIFGRARRIPVDTHSCRRVRQTAVQAALPWRERARNVRGAFDCATDFTGRRLLLIDDVMTTGTSLDELARTLKLHGAAQVSVLALARALPPSQDA
ncbi:MAG TPA: ComF family protein [Candidatus Accumulibacter phosphatis]|nr:MAG: DNA utilization protein GntX [Candidatus Accumulibacter sp. SK-11]HAY25927.1 ComF family protein [Accumulibacter sp.]HCN69356.1 ComF family protein [Accumulibacter sp.]HRL76133.1 ComF family protein [Candidatus Accumulibacter phosphatis]HRQ95370.1 ComF family protein [Candidatus Accumulibacter phosphatis]